ncbi:cobalamin biosynthesis protein CbiX [Streptomyces beijiangensis]|uniref:Cobalamin biosynthesis protein CbiX n=1 Tax=Streptomyces beijiangensis TaxID=163361 RepID=A0A939F338_9ACTN|nr:cobalamin biosynthesis protein CbiX [Streptomyces beijiangensis]MBO0510833.1 cobalamin biosynthesis protein CbiX [Streptomyces beijiangensis]
MTAQVLGRSPAATATVILAGGHESGEGRALGPRAVPAGRALHEAVEAALDSGAAPVCVVPMTLGRDPKLIADTARTLKWLARGAGSGRIALAEPFGAKDHLIGWLRAAAGRAVAAAGKEGTAVLVCAPAAGPFDDADLFRVARLVRQYGHHTWVEVAFDGGDPDIAQGVERCRRLGAGQVALVSAGFGPAAAQPVADAVDCGPLLAPSAVGGVIDVRTETALHRLGHGDDGIAAGLDAEHGHGYAHSHGPGEHGHAHPHPDPQHSHH